MRAKRVHLRRTLGVVTGLAAACLVACGGASRPETPPAVPAAGREAPIVEFAGCSGATKAPQPLRCTLPSAERVIHLFVSATAVPLVELDDAPAEARTAPTIGEPGWTIAVSVPATAKTLAVRYADATDGDATWTIALDRIAPTPTVDAIEKTVPDQNSPGRTPALLDAITKLEASAPTLEPHERHRALRLATAYALDAGQIDRVLTIGNTGLRAALDASELFNVIDFGEVLLYVTNDDTEKESLLKVLEVSIRLAGDGQNDVRLAYARGYRAYLRGDIGSALADFEKSERMSRRLGLVSDELAAAAQRTGLLALVGDAQGCERGSERIVALVVDRPAARACVDAQVLIATAWNVQTRRLLGDKDADPRLMLERIAAYFAPGGGCAPGDNPMLLNSVNELHLLVARDAMTRGDHAASQAEMSALPRTILSENQKRWAAFIDGQIALTNGDAGAALRSTEGLSGATGQALLPWKAALLRSDARLEQNDREGALAEALLAEAALDRAAGQLAPDQGREGMAAAFHVSAARVLELQLEKGDVAGAVLSARRARARRLRPVGSAAALANASPEARGRYQQARARYLEAWSELEKSLTTAWTLPTEERTRAAGTHHALEERMRAALRDADAALRETSSTQSAFAAPRGGEITLLYHPLSRGWVGFAISERGVEVHRFDLPRDITGQSASDALLMPFRGAIADAERVRVLAVGELLEAPVHALPWDDKPLIHAKPVEYGLDLGGSAVAPIGNRSAVVVADPATRIPGLGRLPKAAAEGESVAQRLAALGWDVVRLTDVNAESHAVIRAWEGADWLHYAGHGIAAGRTGWDSALPLAGESSLDVRDVMSAPRVPPNVVLSACDTAGSSTVGTGMQIASAFLLAGAEFVVAAQGGVSDDAAPRFSAALYGAAGSDLRGSDLVRAAVIALDENGEPMSTWVGFRVWVR